MSKFQAPKTDTALHCPNCLRPVKKNLDFCLECGDFVQPFEGDDAARTGRTGHTNLAPRPPKRPRRLESNKIKGPVLLTAAVLGIALICLFAVTVYECCTSYDAAHKDLVRLAQKYIASGDEENAVNVLERSLLEEKHPKQEERRILLDQALYALAAKMVSQGKYRDAVTCYSRISPIFDRHDEVEKLIADYSDKALPQFFVQSGPAPETIEVESGQAGAARKEKSRSMTRLEKAVMTAVPSPASSSTTADTTTDATNITHPTTSGRAQLPERIIESAVAKPKAASAADDPQVSSMARYNELLAGYFAHKNGSSARDSESVQSEPPSYEEWVKAGTKDF